MRGHDGGQGGEGEVRGHGGGQGGEGEVPGVRGSGRRGGGEGSWWGSGRRGGGEGSWACGVCCGVLWEEGVGQVVGQWSSSSHPPPCGVHCA